MKVLGLVGWSGSGKTSLLERLLPRLIQRGLMVSTIKHGHHHMDLDKAGKDTYRHREAGATEVMAASAGRWALMHELRGTPEPSVEELIARMTPVDLILIEGFKAAHHDKLEVHRPALGEPLLCRDDPNIVAVASDVALSGLKVPNLDLQDVPAIADFVVEHCGLGTKVTA